MNVTLLVRIGEFDAEINTEVGSYSEIAGEINTMIMAAPEIKPRPRFNNGPKVELPFDGVIEKTEYVKGKDGKKDHCLAHVKHGDGTLVPVRYFPPQKTWQAGEKVRVVKGGYGPELKEIDDDADDQIPF